MLVHTFIIHLFVGHGTCIWVIYHGSKTNQIPGTTLYNDPVLKNLYYPFLNINFLSKQLPPPPKLPVTLSTQALRKVITWALLNKLTEQKRYMTLYLPIPADPTANNIPMKTLHSMGKVIPHLARPG